MKKFISISISLLIFAFAGFSQDITNTIGFAKGSTIYEKSYNIELDGTTDSAYFNIFLNKDYPVQYQLEFDVDTVAGADTLLRYNLYGRVFSDNSWTQIKLDSATISAAATKSFTSVTSPTWTLNADSTITTTSGYASYYRYLQLRVMRAGDDATGGGIELNKVRMKIWERKY